MSDLISRADAISVLEIFTQTDVLGHTPKQIVEALPSAQPEIIRCKDCKHRPDTAWFGCPMVSSLKWHLDGFCSYAERRTDENNNSI